MMKSCKTKDVVSRRGLHCACVLLTSLSMFGCGDATPDYAADLVAVAGYVEMDGKPVEGAVVTFLANTGPSRSTSATTGPDGGYTLATPPAGDGVLPGDYSVVISKFTLPDGSPVPPETPPMDVGAIEQLPEKYSSFAEPTLTAEVGTDGAHVDFKLEGT